MKRLAGFVSACGLVLMAACGQSDTGITTKVKMAMAGDPVVKAYDVDVTTRNKVVTLSGNVETTAAKDQAVRIAHETEGVRDVIDRLHVNETAATSGWLERGDRTVDTGVDATTDAAGKVAASAKRAARKTAEATKKAAAKAKDAVTPDDDRDSDRDGK